MFDAGTSNQRKIFHFRIESKFVLRQTIKKTEMKINRSCQKKSISQLKNELFRINLINKISYDGPSCETRFFFLEKVSNS